MADNVAITAGSGTTIAADDIAGVLHQRVKISQGADGSATDVSSAAPLQVTLANTGANATPVVVDLGSNNDVTATNATAANLKAEVVGAGSAGTANSGVLTIQGIASMTPVQIGDNSSSITVDNAQLSVVGGGTEAAAMRVTIASDSTGVLSVDDNDSSLTVDNAHLTSLGGAISGTEVQVDVVGALPAGTNAIGKLAANSGVDIGDVDVTTVGTITPGTAATSLGKAEDGGHTSGDVGVMALAVRSDTPSTALAGTDLDYTPIAVSSTGAVRHAPISEDFAALANGPQVKKYYTSAGAATDGIIWSPAAGKRWYVTDIFIQVSAAATVTLEDDKAGGDEAIWKAELAANSGWSHSFTTPWFSGEDAADLMITTTAGNVYVMVTGYEI